MLTDTEDDFFYEEDKITKCNMEESAPLLPIESLSFDIASISATNPTDTQLVQKVPSSTSQSNETFDSKATTTISTQPVDDILVTDEMGATVVCAGSPTHNERFYAFARQKFELERLGMTVSTKSVVMNKDESNLIGISIGGGAPLCPCLYIVQIFDGTPAAREGSLESGDELLAINNVSVKGKTKVQVAKMIQVASQQVTIHYNKLHADPERGKSLDIILKKLKHRIVDNMSSNTADTLGLSRAILCNDSLVKRLEELEGTEMMYKGLVEHAKRMLKAYYDLLQTYRLFGDCFMCISTREPQMRASEAFRIFGEFHRHLEKDGLEIIKQIKPILDDLGTYLHKAIPDTKLTVRRYMDAKFTYLSYCLKVKEMDDEEHGFASIQEPLYRVETGNYEYRLILRCRQDARGKFAKLRTDVLEKMELLECKHANDLTNQLRGLLNSLKQLNQSVVQRMDSLPHLFPIEVDFKETDFQYKSQILEPQKLDEDEDQENVLQSRNTCTEIVCGLEAVEEPAPIVNICKEENACSLNDNDSLLRDLGLLGIDLNAKPPLLLNENQHVTDDFGIMAGAAALPTISNNNKIFDFDLFLNQCPSTSPSTATITKSNPEQDLMAVNALETDLLLQ
ncbi:protein interacting with PRKCA 1 isoform 1-T1 [Glossina fuscipes fuscipes]